MLDCLEFDDRLRYLDGLDDAAFLAMDLEYRGATELGGRATQHSELRPPTLPNITIRAAAARSRYRRNGTRQISRVPPGRA